MLTPEQIIALAPDPASAKAGRGLAATASWPLLGSDDAALWGECRGSGAAPYQTRVERMEVAYKCSCPSRKFPCKHVLGLLLLAAAGSVPPAAAPPWVTEWLAQRRDKATKASSPQGDVMRADGAAARAGADAAAAKRAAQREARVVAGLDELDRRLGDTLRLGLARAQAESPRFWEATATRLVDAQAPGLARRVRGLADIAASGTGWDWRMLDAFGALHLLCVAYGRIDALATARRADVRRAIGWTEREDDVLARDGAILEDRWSVVGTRMEKDERFVVHRAWLHGVRSARDALVLQFAMPGAQPAHAFVAGTSFDGRLAYFEASVPQRAAVATRVDARDPMRMPEAEDAAAMLLRYARAVAADPWYEIMPATLAVARTTVAGSACFLADASGRTLPVARSFARPYALHALCGGRPIAVVGEWNGTAFFPLSAFADERFVSLA